MTARLGSFPSDVRSILATPGPIGSTVPGPVAASSLLVNGQVQLGAPYGAISIGNGGSFLGSNAAYSGGFKYIVADYAWYWRCDNPGLSLNMSGGVGTAGGNLVTNQALSVAPSGAVTFNFAVSAASLAVTGQITSNGNNVLTDNTTLDGGTF